MLDHRSLRIRPGVRRGLIWTGFTLLMLVIASIAVLSIGNWNFARESVASLLASRLNRDVSIDGNLSARLLSSHPQVTVERLRIGNPDWVSETNDAEEFATVDRIFMAINLRELLTGDLMFETLEIDNPKVALVRNAEGRGNFQFGENRSEQRGDDRNEADREDAAMPDLPPIKSFTLRGGELGVNDAINRLVFNGKVEAAENSNEIEETPFRLRGEGSLNDEPFKLDLKGGPLANIKMDEPYQFDADVIAGRTSGSATGAFERPFDFASLTATLNIKGENLAHLYYLTGLALPFTPPYQVTGQLRSAERFIEFTKIDGKVGQSDIRGAASVDLTAKRPKLIAKLESKSLNLVDLSPAFGKGVPVDPKTGEVRDSIAPGKMPTDTLLPTYEFQFDRLRSMDAELTLNAASVQTKKLPMQGVEINLRLNDGVLDLDPIVFVLPQGKMAGSIHIDAREAQAKTTLDVRISNVELEQFKGKDAPVAPVDGVLHARAQLSGTGNSVRDFAASADGQFGGAEWRNSQSVCGTDGDQCGARFGIAAGKGSGACPRALRRGSFPNSRRPSEGRENHYRH
jgi:uncharacterized protein involved in outer membrane biogenesis